MFDFKNSYITISEDIESTEDLAVLQLFGKLIVDVPKCKPAEYD